LVDVAGAGQAAAVLEAALVLEEDELDAPLPAATADEESDEDESLLEELVAVELAASAEASFGRCCVDPPAEPDRLSFL
jgi:hypothetical protein